MQDGFEKKSVWGQTMRNPMKASRCLGVTSVIGFLACLGMIACASSPGVSEVEAPTGVAPDDPIDSTEIADGPEHDPEPDPLPDRSVPGKLHVVVKASGQPASGNLRILTADINPRIVDEGSTGETYEVPAGRYDIDVILEDTIDRPEKRLRDVPVTAGQVTEREIEFTIGQLTLQPRQGKRKVGSDIRWRYAGGGDWFERSSKAGEEVELSTGRFDAEVLVGNTKVTIRDIQVYEGRRTISPEIQMR
jgi:hypothetical protein